MTTSKAIRRPVIRYHGGKWRMAPWIIEQFPQHRVYVEPFAGAASVLLQKQRSHTEVYNDLWDDVVDVFRILRDPNSAEQLRQACMLTPFSRTELFSDEPAGADDIERSRRMIFRSYAGFGSASSNSLHKTGFRGNSRASGQAPPMDWANWPAFIPDFVDRLRGVCIENKPAVDVIAQYDDPTTLVYCDPPYVQSTRGMRRRNEAYRHEMTDNDHRELAELLHRCKSMVIISGYSCDLYDELYGDWQRRDRTAYADGASKRVESVWLNPVTTRHGQQQMVL